MAEFMHVRNKKLYVTRRKCVEKEYFKLYRFREESVEWLANYFLGDDLFERRGGALSKKKQMEIFLRFLSDPGFQIGIANEEGVHRSTVCKVIKDVLENIANKSGNWIKFPTSLADIKTAQDQWVRRFGFPFAIGAIDCTHVQIQKPTSFGDEYVNRKGYCSINVQATCNANEEFTSIDAQWPGSVHDSRILKQSRVFQLMNQQNSDALLLGDVGYGIRSWLLTPHKNPTNNDEEFYNMKHAKSRIIIERCFGQLKRRFPILQYKVRINLNKVPSVIACCVVLHNISKYLNDTYIADAVDPEIVVELDVEASESISCSNDNSKILGERKRREVTNILRVTANNED